jgi:ATP-dependent Clp protease ATP-binding subunit ClpB
MGCTAKLLNPATAGPDAQKLEADLRRKVVGQDEAIEQVVQIYQTDLAGMSTPGRPIGSVLFLGPTGSGKTRLVEAVAESLVGSARAVVKVDCAEFQHSHEIAKLIGSPPGYLGHRETHAILNQQALNQHHTEKVEMSFVLFDEIEKASDALWQLLLGVLDKATLTLGDNHRVDFSRSLIFMTSNLGTGQMSSLVNPWGGFAAADAQRRQDGGRIDDQLRDKVARAGVEAARRHFTPEFMNRIDRTVVFHPLGAAELRSILIIELNAVQERILQATGIAPFALKVTEPAMQYLLREGTDLKYGARHLKRAIESRLVHPLANLMATSQVGSGDVVRVDFDPLESRLSFFRDGMRAGTTILSRMTSSMAERTSGASDTEATLGTVGWWRAKSTKR